MKISVLWQYWDTPGGWHGWVDIGAPPGGATSAPAAVWWQSNTRMDVYTRGTDYLLWSRYYCTQLGPVCPHARLVQLGEGAAAGGYGRNAARFVTGRERTDLRRSN